MLNPAVFEKLDFPAVALVVCSEEKVAHKFDRLSEIRVARAAGECGN